MKSRNYVIVRTPDPEVSVFVKTGPSQKRSPMERTAFKASAPSALAPVGKRGKRLASGDKAFREAVKARDGGVCVLCPNPGEHVHHLWTRGSQPQLRQEPDAGCLLCARCHTTLHADGDMAMFRRWYATVSKPFRAIYDAETDRPKRADAVGGEGQ